MFFVARFAVDHLVIHEPNEREFYAYDPHTGAWTPRTADAIKAMFSEDWQRYANEVGEPALVPLRTNGLLDSLTSLLRGHVEKPDAFAKTGRVIHLANGMLHLDNDGAELREFSLTIILEMSARFLGIQMLNARDSEANCWRPLWSPRTSGSCSAGVVLCFRAAI
jgi:hypothetical protein